MARWLPAADENQERGSTRASSSGSQGRGLSRRGRAPASPRPQRALQMVPAADASEHLLEEEGSSTTSSETSSNSSGW